MSEYPWPWLMYTRQEEKKLYNREPPGYQKKCTTYSTEEAGSNPCLTYPPPGAPALSTPHPATVAESRQFPQFISVLCKRKMVTSPEDPVNLSVDPLDPEPLALHGYHGFCHFELVSWEILVAEHPSKFEAECQSPFSMVLFIFD